MQCPVYPCGKVADELPVRWLCATAQHIPELNVRISGQLLFV
jgi:hypothetical protein